MPHVRRSLAGLALLLVLPLSGGLSAAAGFEERARDLENKLMAPCCGANTVREHDSGAAMRMRSEIRQMLSEGQSEREILDHFVAIHGETILAMPEARGFNLLAYLLPAVAIIVASVFLFVAMRTWQSRPAERATRGPLPKLDDADRERLERELHRFT